MEALKTFKENLFEKRVGGLSTSPTVSGDAHTYTVHWDAYSLDLGKTLRYGTGQSDDVYCTFSVSNAFVDNLTFYANAGNHTLEDLFMDVYWLGGRLNALGFRKAPSFGYGAVSQYVGNYRKAINGTAGEIYPDESVGWSEFSHLDDDNAQAYPGFGKLNDFSLMRIGKIAIVQGSAWYKFKGYLGNTENPELLLKVSIPEGFRPISGGLRCLAFSAFVQPGDLPGSFTPSQFPSKNCFVFDYTMDGLGRSFGMTGGKGGENLIIMPYADDRIHMPEFWLRCPTGPDKNYYQSIRLTLNGWWQCEEGLPEPTE